MSNVFGTKSIDELLYEFEATCEICARNLSDNNIKVHKCNHGVRVCADCLEKLFLIQARQQVAIACPYCRAGLNEIQIEIPQLK